VLYARIFGQRTKPVSSVDGLLVESRCVPLLLLRHPRARRYVLRLCADGTARVTIPRGGSIPDARRFAERHTVWLERQLVQFQAHSPIPAARSAALSGSRLNCGDRAL